MGDVGRSVANIANTTVNGFGQMLGNATGIGPSFHADPYSISHEAFLPNQQELDWNRFLINQMNGNGPSPAQLQMMQGLDVATKNAMGLAASQRGISPALAARLASVQQGNLQAQANQQAGVLRAQEQIGASELLGHGLQSQRQSRMAEQELKSGQNLGYNQIDFQGHEGQANRGSKFVNNLGQMLTHIGSSAGGFGGFGKAAGGLIEPNPGLQMQNRDDSFMAKFAQSLANQVGQAMAVNAKQMEGGE